MRFGIFLTCYFEDWIVLRGLFLGFFGFASVSINRFIYILKPKCVSLACSS